MMNVFLDIRAFCTVSTEAGQVKPLSITDRAQFGKSPDKRKQFADNCAPDVYRQKRPKC
jgi:hypothetical protein